MALLDDGVATIVLEEERFNREKHTTKFPFRCLEAAFDGQGLGVDDIDVITTPWEMKSLRRNMFWAVAEGLPASLHMIPPSARPHVSTLIVAVPMGLRWGLMWHFGMHKKLLKIVQVKHHDAHAAIFFASPFEEAAVLVMDGHGDETAQSAYIGSGNRLQRLWQSEVFDSLGFLYTAATAYLGFKPFAEGTVMALAGTGRATYANQFRELVHLEPEGRFSINRDLISYDTHGVKKPFKEWFTEAFGPRRLPDQPISDRHRDLAFALQSTIEETILHVVRALSKRHPSRNLCLTGGVALNCVANARILRDTDYEFSLGAALRLGLRRSPRQRVMALSSNAWSSARLRAQTFLPRPRIYRRRDRVRAPICRVVLSADGRRGAASDRCPRRCRQQDRRLVSGAI